MSHRLLTIAGTGLIAIASTQALAQEQFRMPEGIGTINHQAASPAVFVEPDFIHAESADTVGLQGLHVTIINEDGAVVAEQRTGGEPISFLISELGLPDGNYRYEVNAVYESAGSSIADQLNTPSSREFGTFTISGGQIEKPGAQRGPGTDDQASAHEPSWPVRLAGAVLDFVVADAQAANDGNKAFGNVCLGDPSCDDASLPQNSHSGSFNDLTILDTEGSGVTHIEIENEDRSFLFEFDNSILELLDDSDSSQIASFSSNNDVLLGNGRMFVDASSGVHIGATTTPTGQLQLTNAGTAGMALYNSNTINGANILWQTGAAFQITYSLLTIPFTIQNAAPNNALVINDTGTVGLSASGSAIHVGSQDDPVGQFAITENGIVRFEMIRTDLGNRWRFTNAGDKFAINNVDADSPDTDFNMFKTGDLVIAGALTQNSDRNAKQDIVAVDRNDVLAKIARLPIAEWSYKDTPDQRHIGPMAQDFYAAFGLGMNEKGISSLDSGGVALAGIQALVEENRQLRQELDELKAQQTRLQSVVLQIQEEQRTQRILTSNLTN